MLGHDKLWQNILNLQARFTPSRSMVVGFTGIELRGLQTKANRSEISYGGIYVEGW